MVAAGQDPPPCTCCSLCMDPSLCCSLFLSVCVCAGGTRVPQGNVGGAGLPYTTTEEVHTAYKARSACGWSLFNAVNNKDRCARGVRWCLLQRFDPSSTVLFESLSPLPGSRPACAPLVQTGVCVCLCAQGRDDVDGRRARMAIVVCCMTVWWLW
jgi:hypothetical protein